MGPSFNFTPGMTRMPLRGFRVGENMLVFCALEAICVAFWEVVLVLRGFTTACPLRGLLL